MIWKPYLEIVGLLDEKTISSLDSFRLSSLIDQAAALIMGFKRWQRKNVGRLLVKLPPAAVSIQPTDTGQERWPNISKRFDCGGFLSNQSLWLNSIVTLLDLILPGKQIWQGHDNWRHTNHTKDLCSPNDFNTNQPKLKVCHACHPKNCCTTWPKLCLQQLETGNPKCVYTLSYPPITRSPEPQTHLMLLQ